MLGLNFYITTHFLTAVVSLFISGIVILKNKKSITNITLSLFSFAIFLWSVSYGIWLLSADEVTALFWARTLNLGATLIPVFLFHWMMSFLGMNEKKKSLIIFYYILTAFFALFAYNGNYIWGVIRIGQFPYWPQINWLYITFLLVCWIPIFFYSFILLIRELKIRKSSARQQVLYVLIGLVVGFLGGSTNYLLTFNIESVSPLGSALVIVFPICFSYAVIRHRLMDIKLVMRRYSVYLASLTLILFVVVGIKYFFDRYFPQYSDWIDLVLLMTAISVYPAIRARFYRMANKYFFSSLYDSGEVIAALSDKLRSTLDTKIIFEVISETLVNAFHVKAVGVLTYSENTKKYIITYNNGFNAGRQKEFDEDKDLNEIFIKRNRTIIVDDIKAQFKNNKTLEILLKLGVEILTPLNVKDKTIGLIALGTKESGDMYNDEDLKVLEVVGAQTAIALENALLYKETKNFSVKMEKEVEKATRDLRKANVQLKKLDEAKSEFISIASHQLRTPLTVIKGYISMMLEGNFGTLTKPETESLEKVFLSNERLIQLVENLLNISRIESGRLQFDLQAVDLNSMVESVVEELSGNAKKKSLILQYKPPIEPLPKIKADDEKIRQVVMNLIDNAIKYTKQGSVTVKLEQQEKKIKFSVADSGMGVKPEDMVNLFKKFSRGTGTSLIHTEGTGLGLYVARMMIEAHKGKIWAESDGEGKGSKFCFELPMK